MVHRFRHFCLLALSLPALSFADLRYEVRGVDDVLRANILAFVDTVQYGPQVRLSERDLEEIRARLLDGTRGALRPYGYYAPEISISFADRESREPTAVIDIIPGLPVRVAATQIDLAGPGAGDRLLRRWQADWALTEGSVLNHGTWESQKREGIDIANSRGYLSAAYSTHALEVDLERNTARAALTLDTGPRYVMGDIDFGEHVLRPGILEFVPRFDKGDFYTARMVSTFRTDLWRTGYFTDVIVEEIPRPEAEPPTVDFRVSVETERRNVYKGALGYGTDTGIRVQTNWSRHPMSSSGARLDLGLGWRELDDQLRLRTTYRQPRPNRARQFWVTDLTLNFENLDLEVKRDPEDENFVTLAHGDIGEQHLRFGRLKVRNFESGEHQAFETLFVQYLVTDRKFKVSDNQPGLQVLADDPDFERLLDSRDGSLSFGFDWDLIAVEGKFFQTSGHRERAWIFHSDEAFGSDADYTQAYVSTRRSYLFGDRFKVLVRGEVGYTDAAVTEVEIDPLNDNPLLLSVSRLPNFYRFKAGGSMSVRGYGFEQLSDNDIGSNHIITGSLEAEYRFLDRWSAAVFYDIGNAFNDWSDPDLKRGVGVGLRWHSIAGEIRVDMARALDFEDDPWRLHVTIGTPLL